MRRFSPACFALHGEEYSIFSPRCHKEVVKCKRGEAPSAKILTGDLGGNPHILMTELCFSRWRTRPCTTNRRTRPKRWRYWGSSPTPARGTGFPLTPKTAANEFAAGWSVGRLLSYAAPRIRRRIGRRFCRQSRRFFGRLNALMISSWLIASIFSLQYRLERRSRRTSRPRRRI